MTCACFPAPHGDESADSSALVPACAGGLSPAIVSFGSSIHSVWLVLRVAPSHITNPVLDPQISSDETGFVRGQGFQLDEYPPSFVQHCFRLSFELTDDY